MSNPHSITPNIELTLPMVLPTNPHAGYLAHQAEIDSAVLSVLSRGTYILGEEVGRFEAEFAEWMGGGFAIGVANGTDALELCLRAVGVGEGDWVVVPSHTAVATAAAVVRAGARPLFLDIDPHSFLLDAKAFRRALENQVRDRVVAVIPVHLYGAACNMDEILEVATHYGLKVIEDCSQAHGALWRGNKVGTFGDAAAFSCYPTKNLGAFGDAGVSFSKNEAYSDRIKMLRQYGWRIRYISDEPGMNSRLDEIQAATLRVKLKYLDSENAARIRVAGAYHRAFAHLPIQLPKSTPDESVSVYHQYTIRVPERDALKASLQKFGILASILYPLPIHQQAGYFQYLTPEDPSRANSESACRDLLCLPIHPHLPEMELDRVIASVLGFFQK